MLVHEVLPQTVDPLERLALGGAVFAQAVEPSVLLPHRHVHFGNLHVGLVSFGVFQFLRNLVIGDLTGDLMVHHVLLERGSDLEHLSALFTLELFDVGVVQLAVLSQVALLAEAQPASLANKRFLACDEKISNFKRDQ